MSATPYVRRLTTQEKERLFKEGYPSRWSVFGKKLVYSWITTKEVRTVLPCGAEVVVPKGFICDGGWAKRQRLAHDWLYASAGFLELLPEGMLAGGPICRKQADAVFTGRWIHRWVLARLLGSFSWDSGIYGRIRQNLLDEDTVSTQGSFLTTNT